MTATVYRDDAKLRAATLAYCESAFRRRWGVEWSEVAVIIDDQARLDAVTAANEARAAEVRDRLRAAIDDAVRFAAAEPSPPVGPVGAALRRFVADAGLPAVAHHAALVADLRPHEPAEVLRWRLVRAVHFGDWGGWSATNAPAPRFSAGEVAIVSILSGSWPSVSLPATVAEAIERERKAIGPHLRRFYGETIDRLGSDDD